MANNNTVMPILINEDNGKRSISKVKGISKHPLYLVRRAMIHRCYNPKVKCYHNYGGRGIKVCDEWLNSQEQFINYCEFFGWRKGLQVDRIDNNGNYEPDNIRFVYQRQNSRNMRKNVRITIGGVEKIMEDWCQFYNIRSKLVQQRIKLLGWTPEAALTTPTFDSGGGFNRRFLSPEQAEEVRLKYSRGGVYQWQLADEYGVSTSTINGAILRKWNRYKT